jgi:hypothetical protein
MKLSISIALLVAGLVSCGGEGASSTCKSIGPNTNFATVAGGVDKLSALADGNLSTFATFTTQTAGSYVGSQGNDFPAGSRAGAFLTRPSNATAADITISTSLQQEQVIVESATGPALTITPTPGDPAAEYVSFTTTRPFDGIRVTVNTAGSAENLVFEICGDATVR